MYKNFFRLQSNPFGVSPDPGFLVVTEHTLEAMACLCYGVQHHAGFVQLTGEVGTGKTMLLNVLLRRLHKDPLYQSAFIFNSRLNADDFLDFVRAEFGIVRACDRKSELLRQLNQWLLDRFSAGQTAVLIVDEAQNLSADVLEEIRLLANLETATQKLLQIVLAGQPELELKLKNPSLRQLRQRITIRCKTYPLTYEDTANYIENRLQLAGCPTRGTFSAEAMQAVFEYSRGIPRIINALCQNALIGGYVDSECPILRTTVERVAKECELDELPPLASATEEREVEEVVRGGEAEPRSTRA